MIYWSYDKIPELAGKNQADREAAVKAVSNVVMKHWEWWVALAVACCTTAVGAWLGGVGISGAVGAGIGGGFGGVAVHVAGIFVARKYYSARLRGTAAA
jgi:hypothetical protein